VLNKNFKKANFPEISFFKVLRRASDNQQLDVVGKWEVCTPSSMKDFSALAYLFGKNLYENLNVPIGLIQSTWGSTSLEVWLNPHELQKVPILYERAIMRKEAILSPIKPGSTWWAMVEPLKRFRIAA